MEQPAFKSRTDQLVHYARGLARVCIDVAREAGVTNLPDSAAVDILFDTLPPEIIVAYIAEADEKFGKKLEEEEDLASVAKLVALGSCGKTASDIAEDMTNFVGVLERYPALKKKFFCHIKVLRRILHS